mmetsp:Transcript_1484/g.2418  ORF Transcript_1484/g.2418 Transcript_1484/m.2418 type:complete len:395 (-) Transcript_1484:222-1406(-)
MALRRHQLFAFGVSCCLRQFCVRSPQVTVVVAREAPVALIMVAPTRRRGRRAGAVPAAAPSALLLLPVGRGGEGRRGRALGLVHGGVAAQAVELAHELLGLHVLHPAEARLHDLEEGAGREQAVRAGLVHGPHALHVQLLGQPLQAAVHAVHAGHQVLDVEDVREVELEHLEEAALLGGQRLRGQQLQQVAEVVAAVEGDPLDAVHQHQPGGGQQLAEPVRVHAPPLVRGEADARALQQVDGLLRVHVLAQAEPEVHLPAAAARHRVAVRLHEGQAELDDLKQVHIAPQRLVLVVRAVVVRDGPGHHAREFSVHCNVMVFLCHFSNFIHFCIEIICPHLPNLDADSFTSFEYTTTNRRSVIVIFVLMVVMAAQRETCISRHEAILFLIPKRKGC